MKFTFLKKRKFWRRFILITILLPVLFLSAIIAYIYVKQDDIIQNEITILNQQHKGLITVGDTHLSLFGNFPDLSFKVDDVHIYETKEDDAPVILDVADIYMGFNIWDIVNGDYIIRSLLIEEGFFNMVVHPDRSLNYQNALTPFEKTEGGEFSNIQLRNIKLRNLDIHKRDETTKTDLEAFVYEAVGGFKINNDTIAGHVDTEFEMNLIDHGDTTYIRHKHFELDLERYKNAGKIYFNAVVQGPTLHEQIPFIDVQFGASEAFLENTDKGKRVNDMGFSGHFTNGEERSLRTMKFSLRDMTAKLDKGAFYGNVVINNFEEPEVDMQLNADFDLEFMASFLNLKI